MPQTAARTIWGGYYRFITDPPPWVRLESPGVLQTAARAILGEYCGFITDPRDHPPPSVRLASLGGSAYLAF